MLSHRVNHVGLGAVATIGGIALVVLGALALYHIDRFLFLGILDLVAGLVLIIVSGELALELERAATLPAETGGGLSGGVLGGVAGIVLGALTIIGVLPGILSACAVVVFGAAVLFDFLAFTQSMWARTMDTTGSVAGVPAPSAPGGYSSVLIAIALITLGIIALVFGGAWGAVLISIAFIAFGGYFLLSVASNALVGYAVPEGRRVVRPTN